MSEDEDSGKEEAGRDTIAEELFEGGEGDEAMDERAETIHEETQSEYQDLEASDEDEDGKWYPAVYGTLLYTLCRSSCIYYRVPCYN